MPLKPGITVGEAREELSSFLKDTGCYDICASCPTYPGGEGCCHGCPSLLRGEGGQVQGCGKPNLSCLTYTCGVLNEHLRRLPSEEGGSKLDELTQLIYGIPREGYRGCELRPTSEVIQIQDPLEISASLRRDSGILSSLADKRKSSASIEGD